jgi:hypothetical protein
MLATSSNVLENDSSESRDSVNSVQPSAAHYTNKQLQIKNIYSIQTIKKSPSFEEVESSYFCYIGPHANFQNIRTAFENIPLFWAQM